MINYERKKIKIILFIVCRPGWRGFNLIINTFIYVSYGRRAAGGGAGSCWPKWTGSNLVSNRSIVGTGGGAAGGGVKEEQGAAGQNGQDPI